MVQAGIKYCRGDEREVLHVVHQGHTPLVLLFWWFDFGIDGLD